MAGPIRTQQMPAEVQPPRPPNAWILYRSDKLRELPPPPPGAPRRPQAEISKAISQMWRNESPDVRAYYERMSDIRKAEHNVLHPGYRFKPVKKADKERQRAEQKAEKERAKAELRSTKGGAAPTTHRRARSTEQQFEQFAFDGRWGPVGPSPSSPSASSSPAPFVSDPRFSPYPSPHSHSIHAFPPSSPAPEPTSFSSAPMHFEFQAQIPGMFPQQQQQQQQPRQQACSPTPPSPFDELNWLAPEAQDNTLDDSEYLSIPLPTGTSSSWASDASLQNAFFSPDNLQATLSPTSDPSMFHLANFDTSNLFANPGADIEIALPQSVTFRDLEHLGVFGEFAHLLEPHPETSPVERSFPSSLDIPERSSDPLGGLDARLRQTSISSPPPPHRHLSATPPALNEYIITTPPQDAVQPRSVSNLSHTTVASFINHSADHFRSSPSPPPSKPAQPIRYTSSNNSNNVSASSPRSQRQRSASAHEQQPYVPPVGAANAGGRRVAASWRNTFALEGSTVKEVWSNV